MGRTKGSKNKKVAEKPVVKVEEKRLKKTPAINGKTECKHYEESYSGSQIKEVIDAISEVATNARNDGELELAIGYDLAVGMIEEMLNIKVKNVIEEVAEG